MARQFLALIALATCALILEESRSLSPFVSTTRVEEPHYLSAKGSSSGTNITTTGDDVVSIAPAKSVLQQEIPHDGSGVNAGNSFVVGNRNDLQNKTTTNRSDAIYNPVTPTATADENSDQAQQSTIDAPSSLETTDWCSTEARRALALREDTNAPATEEEWKAMTECTIQRDRQNKLGQFFLHVSKSGGTSMVELWNKKGCLLDTGNMARRHHPVDNSLGFGTHWYKRTTMASHSIKMPSFGFMNTKLVKGTSCKQMEHEMNRKNRLALMSEAVIPFETDPTTTTTTSEVVGSGGGGGCRKYLSSMIFREPISRIVSHYRHLEFVCKSKSTCREMFHVGTTGSSDGGGGFDVQYMREKFPTITDNYYTRSLVGHGFYEWENMTSTLIDHPKAWSEILPIANASLHSFDWIMILGNKANANEPQNLDEVLQFGLGFGINTKLGHARKSKKLKKNHPLLLDPTQEATLKNINTLDSLLWKEALELNRLDILSLQRMKPYYLEYFANNKPRGQLCCGHICRNPIRA